ncbi:MAG TPA: prephenate dehydrogenase [Candidatus Omnitrophota bacterium]|nr:prephenate dehydrogenase [Candidatus Omnitrophota bacterium]HPT38927.1 prephenate dehydrogenase [Candidatus Omnitrophota bacterium]
MKMFNKVVIIGTGLIGGSLGLALRKQHLAGQIIGLSRHQKNARFAKRIGAIDVVGASLKVLADADLVILAMPVDAIIRIAPEIAEKIKKECLVIDVGSTKERIVSEFSALIPNFVGCHPLAGSEKKGIVNLQDSIFKGSICVITPTKKTSKITLDKIKRLWQKLGARITVLPAKKHDQILALTSHLPHAIAFSLISAIPEQFLGLSSNGLRDATRIAGSDADLWGEIFLSNRGNLLKALSVFQIKLAALKFALKNKDKERLTKILRQAKQKREKLG